MLNRSDNRSINRTGFLHQTRPLASHRYPRSITGPIRPKSPLELRFVMGRVLGNINQGPPHLKGGACVRRVVLDPIAGSRQRQGPGGVAGGGVDPALHDHPVIGASGRIRILSSGHWLMIFLTRVSARLTRRGWMNPLWRTT